MVIIVALFFFNYSDPWEPNSALLLSLLHKSFLCICRQGLCLSALAHACSYVDTSPSFPSAVPRMKFQTISHHHHQAAAHTLLICVSPKVSDPSG